MNYIGNTDRNGTGAETGFFLQALPMTGIRVSSYDADAAKEKNHKRRGAAPPLKVLLF